MVWGSGPGAPNNPRVQRAGLRVAEGQLFSQGSRGLQDYRKECPGRGVRGLGIIYIYIYVCMYLYLYLSTYIYIYVFMCMCMCVCVRPESRRRL